jgi:hypothetical protein
MRENLCTRLCALCELCGEFFFAVDFQLATVNFLY